MMDWTDRHCRYLHRLISPHARLYTEMVVTHAIRHGDREKLLGFLRTYPDSEYADEARGLLTEISDLVVRKQMRSVDLYRRLKKPESAAIVMDRLLTTERRSTLLPRVLLARAEVAPTLEVISRIEEVDIQVEDGVPVDVQQTLESALGLHVGMRVPARGGVDLNVNDRGRVAGTRCGRCLRVHGDRFVARWTGWWSSGRIGSGGGLGSEQTCRVGGDQPPHGDRPRDH